MTHSLLPNIVLLLYKRFKLRSKRSLSVWKGRREKEEERWIETDKERERRERERNRERKEKREGKKEIAKEIFKTKREKWKKERESEKKRRKKQREGEKEEKRERETHNACCIFDSLFFQSPSLSPLPLLSLD